MSPLSEIERKRKKIKWPKNKRENIKLKKNYRQRLFNATMKTLSIKEAYKYISVRDRLKSWERSW